MSDDNEQALVQACTNITCARCSRIPWDQLLENYGFRTIRWTQHVSNVQEPKCRVCRFLDNLCGQYASPGPSLCFSYEQQYLRKSLRLEHKQVCCISAGAPSSRGTEKPHILVTRLEPGDIQHAVEHMFPKEVDFAKLRSWVTDCETLHDGHCEIAPDASLADFKVIDCQHRTIVSPPHGCRFAALSYVWGDRPGQITSLSEWTSLPKTIQDSIQVTQNLGIKYLWIDRYCIDQHDAQEKHVQISQMGQIYRAAHVTIVAAAGASPEYGLPGVQRIRQVMPTYETVASVHLYNFPEIRRLEDAVNTPWNRRAWTYQEVFFSRRRLIFTDRQVIFVCNAQTHFEAANPTGWAESEPDSSLIAAWIPSNSSQRDNDSATRGSILQAMEYLEEYSRRVLSYDEDALNAVTGALNTLAEDHVYHICGAPLSFPASISHAHAYGGDDLALFWSHRTPARRRPNFPSWSSVGWEGEIHWTGQRSFSRVGSERFRLLGKLGRQDLRISALTGTISELPQLLEIKARIVDFKLIYRTVDSDHKSATHTAIGAMMTFDKTLNLLFWPAWDIPDEELQNPGQVTGVFFSSEFEQEKSPYDCVVMFLKPQGNHYERIGIHWTSKIFRESRPPLERRNLQICDQDMRPIGQEEHEHLVWKYKSYIMHEWWWELARKETIVLG